MKTFLTILFLISAATLYSQNINNTLGTGGSFNILDGTTTFFSLSQSNSYIQLSKIGIFKGLQSFIHDYQAPGTDGWNTFIGLNAGNFSMTGSSLHDASYNTAVGYYSLSSLTNGYYNSALGYNSLYFNSTGFYNSAFGASSLSTNTTGNQNSAFGAFSLLNNSEGISNSAFGSRSLYSNTTGNYNSSFGDGSLENNTIGIHNSAFGYQSLYNNTVGYNSAFGSGSLYSNTLGVGNSAFGHGSLNSNTTGSDNTAVGQYAGSNITTGSYNIAIGYLAQVPSATANYQIRIGNEEITYAGVQVAWTVTSDRRWKKNILPSNLGLNFISELKPVSYIRKNDEKERTEYGFIAQEVQQVLKKNGVDNSGMITIDDKGYYQLRYNDLLAPIIKAIQELKNENELLKNKLAELYETIASMSDDKAKEIQQGSVKSYQHTSIITPNTDINKTSE